MGLISPFKLNLTKKLKENKEFRKRFFRGQAQDEVAMSIRSLREKREMRQIDLAKKSQMKQSAISRIEQADYSGWTFNTLLRVGEALDARLRITFEPAENVIARYEIQDAESIRKSEMNYEATTWTNLEIGKIQISVAVASAVGSPLMAAGSIPLDEAFKKTVTIIGRLSHGDEEIRDKQRTIETGREHFAYPYKMARA